MKRSIKSAMLASAAALLVTGSVNLSAQPAGGGGGFRNMDPAQMQAQMMERMKENLEITNDDDWKAISPLVEKVMTAQRESMMGRFRGFGRRGGGGPGGMGGQELTGAMGDLPKAIDGKASNNELKQVLARVAAERKQPEAALTQAQENLRKVLSVRQEALAVFNGMIPPAAK